MNLFSPLIPNENRREQMELRACLGLEKFLDHIWRERLRERLNALPFKMCRTKAKGTWPHVREVDKPRTNVQPLRKSKP